MLVFTADGPGWSWCMWEVGVATDLHDEVARKVVVLQCGDASPARTSIRSASTPSIWSRTGFVKQLLATNDLFPNQPSRSRLRRGPSEAARARRRSARQAPPTRSPSCRRRTPRSAGRPPTCASSSTASRRRAARPSRPDGARTIAERGRIVDKQGANALFGRRVCRGESVGDLQVGIRARSRPRTVVRRPRRADPRHRARHVPDRAVGAVLGRAGQGGDPVRGRCANGAGDGVPSRCSSTSCRCRRARCRSSSG